MSLIGSPKAKPSNEFIFLFNKTNGMGQMQYLQVDPGKLNRIIPKVNLMNMPKIKEITGQCVVVLNGQLYLIGGRNLVTGALLNQCLSFDPRLNQWSRKGTMVKARTRFTADVLEGCIYVTGGEVRNRFTDEVECYDPVTDTWTTMKHLPKPRADHASCTARDKLWVCGGAKDRKGKGTTTFWQYEPRTDFWIESSGRRSDLPSERHKHMMTSHRDIIYCLGGLSLQPVGQKLRDRDDASILAFDTGQMGELETEILGYWRQDLPAMSVPRCLAAVTTIGHNIFVLGGHNFTKDADAVTVEYFNTYKERWTTCFDLDQGPYTSMTSGVVSVPACNREFTTTGMVIRNKWTLW